MNQEGVEDVLLVFHEGNRMSGIEFEGVVGKTEKAANLHGRNES